MAPSCSMVWLSLGAEVRGTGDDVFDCAGVADGDAAWCDAFFCFGIVVLFVVVVVNARLVVTILMFNLRSSGCAWNRRERDTRISWRIDLS